MPVSLPAKKGLVLRSKSLSHYKERQTSSSFSSFPFPNRLARGKDAERSPPFFFAFFLGPSTERLGIRDSTCSVKEPGGQTRLLLFGHRKTIKGKKWSDKRDAFRIPRKKECKK